MMDQFQNESMPHALRWRLEVAFYNKDLEEIKRLNDIWLHENEVVAS